jgi:hypothetical protein
MTTVNDRLEKLEAGFLKLVEMEDNNTKIFEKMVASLDVLAEGQQKIVETQEQMLETQQAIIASLNRQSGDLELIKGYLG